MTRTERMMEKANKPSYALIVLLLALCLAAYSCQKEPLYVKRLNCEDLGRCNLRTGEVLVTPFTRENATQMVSLYNDEGEVP